MCTATFISHGKYCVFHGHLDGSQVYFLEKPFGDGKIPKWFADTNLRIMESLIISTHEVGCVCELQGSPA